MATIFKRGGKGNWIVQFFNSEGRRVERSSRTTDKRAAERMAHCTVRRRRAGALQFPGAAPSVSLCRVRRRPAACSQLPQPNDAFWCCVLSQGIGGGIETEFTVIDGD
jgi:hypothetical protein